MPRKNPSENRVWKEFLDWTAAKPRDVILYRRCFADITDDVEAALMLAELVYWNLPSNSGKSRLRVGRDGREWMVCSFREWADRARITKYKAEKGIKILRGITLQGGLLEEHPELENKPLIETEIFRSPFHNNKPITHISLNRDVFSILWMHFTSNPKVNPYYKKDEKDSYFDLTSGITESSFVSNNQTRSSENQNQTSGKQNFLPDNQNSASKRQPSVIEPLYRQSKEEEEIDSECTLSDDSRPSEEIGTTEIKDPEEHTKSLKAPKKQKTSDSQETLPLNPSATLANSQPNAEQDRQHETSNYPASTDKDRLSQISDETQAKRDSQEFDTRLGRQTVNADNSTHQARRDNSPPPSSAPPPPRIKWGVSLTIVRNSTQYKSIISTLRKYTQTSLDVKLEEAADMAYQLELTAEILKEASQDYLKVFHWKSDPDMFTALQLVQYAQKYQKRLQEHMEAEKLIRQRANEDLIDLDKLNQKSKQAGTQSNDLDEPDWDEPPEEMTEEMTEDKSKPQFSGNDAALEHSQPIAQKTPESKPVKPEQALPMPNEDDSEPPDLSDSPSSSDEADKSQTARTTKATASEDRPEGKRKHPNFLTDMIYVEDPQDIIHKLRPGSPIPPPGTYIISSFLIDEDEEKKLEAERKYREKMSDEEKAYWDEVSAAIIQIPESMKAYWDKMDKQELDLEQVIADFDKPFDPKEFESKSDSKTEPTSQESKPVDNPTEQNADDIPTVSPADQLVHQDEPKGITMSTEQEELKPDTVDELSSESDAESDAIEAVDPSASSVAVDELPSESDAESDAIEAVDPSASSVVVDELSSEAAESDATESVDPSASSVVVDELSSESDAESDAIESVDPSASSVAVDELSSEADAESDATEAKDTSENQSDNIEFKLDDVEEMITSFAFEEELPERPAWLDAKSDDDMFSSYVAHLPKTPKADKPAIKSDKPAIEASSQVLARQNNESNLPNNAVSEITDNQTHNPFSRLPSYEPKSDERLTQTNSKAVSNTEDTNKESTSSEGSNTEDSNTEEGEDGANLFASGADPPSSKNSDQEAKEIELEMLKEQIETEEESEPPKIYGTWNADFLEDLSSNPKTNLLEPDSRNDADSIDVKPPIEPENDVSDDSDGSETASDDEPTIPESEKTPDQIIDEFIIELFGLNTRSNQMAADASQTNIDPVTDEQSETVEEIEEPLFYVNHTLGYADIYAEYLEAVEALASDEDVLTEVDESEYQPLIGDDFYISPKDTRWTPYTHPMPLVCPWEKRPFDKDISQQLQYNRWRIGLNDYTELMNRADTLLAQLHTKTKETQYAYIADQTQAFVDGYRVDLDVKVDEETNETRYLKPLRPLQLLMDFTQWIIDVVLEETHPLLMPVDPDLDVGQKLMFMKASFAYKRHLERQRKAERKAIRNRLLGSQSNDDESQAFQTSSDVIDALSQVDENYDPQKSLSNVKASLQPWQKAGQLMPIDHNWDPRFFLIPVELPWKEKPTDIIGQASYSKWVYGFEYHEHLLEKARNLKKQLASFGIHEELLPEVENFTNCLDRLPRCYDETGMLIVPIETGRPLRDMEDAVKFMEILLQRIVERQSGGINEPARSEEIEQFVDDIAQTANPTEPIAAGFDFVNNLTPLEFDIPQYDLIKVHVEQDMFELQHEQIEEASNEMIEEDPETEAGALAQEFFANLEFVPELSKRECEIIYEANFFELEDIKPVYLDFDDEQVTWSRKPRVFPEGFFYRYDIIKARFTDEELDSRKKPSRTQEQIQSLKESLTRKRMEAQNAHEQSAYAESVESEESDDQEP